MGGEWTLNIGSIVHVKILAHSYPVLKFTNSPLVICMGHTTWASSKKVGCFLNAWMYLSPPASQAWDFALRSESACLPLSLSMLFYCSSCDSFSLTLSAIVHLGTYYTAGAQINQEAKLLIIFIWAGFYRNIEIWETVLMSALYPLL